MFLKDDPQIFAYERHLDDSNEKLLIFTNFYEKEHSAILPEEYQGKDYELLLGNYDHGNGKLEKEISLKPYEALAIKIK